MATTAQIEANRRNSQLSTGPRTEAGKLRSSRNRLTHGLFASLDALPDHDRERFNQILQSFVDQFNCADEDDELLRWLHELAHASFRIARVRALEVGVNRILTERLREERALPEKLTEGQRLDLEAGVFLNDCENRKAFAQLLRMENAFQRQYNRALAEIKAILEARRKAAAEASFIEYRKTHPPRTGGFCGGAPQTANSNPIPTP
jgi:hypothetical protein